MSPVNYPDIDRMWENAQKICTISEQEFRAFQAARLARQIFVPKVGEPAPDFDLPEMSMVGEMTGTTVKLSSLVDRPIALAFGSYTCPTFRGAVEIFNQIYAKYASVVTFYAIYIWEAHPDDGWRSPKNLSADIAIAKPKSFEEKIASAVKLRNLSRLKLPLLIDHFDNSTEEKYIAHPHRLFVIDRAGVVSYVQGLGSRNFRPDDWADAVKTISNDS
jgi:thiol-disulfide isomerase/thioredoxin